MAQTEQQKEMYEKTKLKTFFRRLQKQKNKKFKEELVKTFFKENPEIAEKVGTEIIEKLSF